jgi:hypothetical protein
MTMLMPYFNEGLKDFRRPNDEDDRDYNDGDDGMVVRRIRLAGNGIGIY